MKMTIPTARSDRKQEGRGNRRGAENDTSEAISG
jgi:hypothetical protein